MYDSIVIGAGAAGATVARELAWRGGRRVLVLEKRDHIGGNCYDLYDEHQIFIHLYGPHIFHTNNEKVFQYLSDFTEWHRFDHEVVANVHGQLIPVPFNLNTLFMVYGQEKGESIKEKLLARYKMGQRVPILKLRESGDEDIQDVAQYIYENIFLYYTMKQWGQKPEEVDAGVTARVPVVISHDNRYFGDKYQGVPKEGFTRLFGRMLEHENITVQLGQDALQRLRFEGNQIFFEDRPFAGEVVYTGEIDALFGYRLGSLPYRSLRFDFEHHDCADYQGHSVVNYTVSEAFTRITEFKHLTGQEADSTTIVKEYPMACDRAQGHLPYYPINNVQNDDLYGNYRKLAENYRNLYLLGRLAEYKYYNIDVIVEKALGLADDILQ